MAKPRKSYRKIVQLPDPSHKKYMHKLEGLSFCESSSKYFDISKQTRSATTHRYIFPVKRHLDVLDKKVELQKSRRYSQVQLSKYLSFEFLKSMTLRRIHDGVMSDIVLNYKGKKFDLHKYVLAQSPYFAALLDSRWTPKHKQLNDLHIRFCGYERVPLEAVELVLNRMYGCHNLLREHALADKVFVVANYLDVPEVISSAVHHICENITISNLLYYINFSTRFEYGAAGRAIQESCKQLLLAKGFEIGIDIWSRVPGLFAADVITSDQFIVNTEWDRAKFFIIIYRLKVQMMLQGKPGGLRKWLNEQEKKELVAMRTALAEKIYFCNLTYEQLRLMKQLIDEEGQPLISPHVLKRALALRHRLRNAVVKARKTATELRITERFGATTEEERRTKCPRCIARDHERAYQQHISNALADDSDFSEISVDLEQAPQAPCDACIALKIAASMDKDFKLKNKKEVFPYYIVPSGLDPEEELEENELDRSGVENMRKTIHPPFRFSMCFNSIRDMQEGRRRFSKPVWYAGSFWCVYIQKAVDRYGTHLGVYLHRCKPDAEEVGFLSQKTITNHAEEFPIDFPPVCKTFSIMTGGRQEAEARILNEEGEVSWEEQRQLMGGGGGGRALHEEGEEVTNPLELFLDSAPTPSVVCTFTTTTWRPSYSPTRPQFMVPAPTPTTAEPYTEPRFTSTAKSDYIDRRPCINAYFEMYATSTVPGCPVNFFSSSPNSFNFLQSWGWRSRSLVSVSEGLRASDAYYNEEDADADDETTPEESPGIKIVVMIGLV